MIPSTYARVPEHTSDEVNQQIRERAEASIQRYLNGSPDQIERRLKELDQEWDIDRAIETESSLMALAGIGLGFGVDRRFFLLPAAVAGFVMLHAVHGWYPLLPLFRRLGFRTAIEINAERFALKAVRGDFDSLSVPGENDPAHQDYRTILDAVRR